MKIGRLRRLSLGGKPTLRHDSLGGVMNDQELKELREWAAGMMGWHKHQDIWWISNDYQTHLSVAMDDETWRPDTDLNQCFMVVKKMRELGFDFHLDNYTDDDAGYGARFQREEDDEATLKLEEMGAKEFADGLRKIKALQKSMTIENTNPCLAILLAARATGVK